MTSTQKTPVPIPLEYLESTITAGMTLGEYRRSRPRRRGRWQRLKQLAGGPSVATA